MSQNNFAEPKTESSLLREVSDPENHRAWEEFIDRYNPMIREWCRQWFPNAADDMAHEVMVKLVFVMKSYIHQPEKGRFRSWLKTVTYHLMADLKRSSKRFVVDFEALEKRPCPDRSARPAGCRVRSGTPGRSQRQRPRPRRAPHLVGVRGNRGAIAQSG